ESVGAALLERGYVNPEDIVLQALATTSKAANDHVVVNEVRGLGDILVDGPQIERVVSNLVENAAKYSDPGTRIRVFAAMDAESITFGVEDQGPGIPPEYREQIFEKFFRIKGGRPRTPGTGLGLPICRGIVEAHGGRLWVETQGGRGSAFLFSLP